MLCGPLKWPRFKLHLFIAFNYHIFLKKTPSHKLELSVSVCAMRRQDGKACLNFIFAVLEWAAVGARTETTLKSNLEKNISSTPCLSTA